MIERSEWGSFVSRQTTKLESHDENMKRDYRSQLAELFEEIDTDANGQVSNAEWGSSELIRFDSAR